MKFLLIMNLLHIADICRMGCGVIALDNNLLMATKLLGAQAGRTLDTITREVLCGGTNVQYAEGQVSARHLLVGGKPEGNHYLTVDCIKRAVRTLKSQNAEKIDEIVDEAVNLYNDLKQRSNHPEGNKRAFYTGLTKEMFEKLDELCEKLSAAVSKQA